MKEKKLINRDSSIKDELLVSIVTVVYNGEKFIEGTIKSVLSQRYKNIEYIIIDGGSSDGTVALIKKYEKELAHWVSEPDEGIYDAMNKGILLAKGSLVGIINADDYYLPNAIETVVNQTIKSEADIFYGRLHIIDRDSSKVLMELGTKKKSRELYQKMSLAHPSIFVKRNVYQDSLFPTKYKIAGDYYFLLNAKINKKKFEYIDSLLVHMRNGGVSDIEAENARFESKAVKKELLGFSRYYLIKFLMVASSKINKILSK